MKIIKEEYKKNKSKLDIKLTNRSLNTCIF